MGLFELQRELAAESASKTRMAKAQAKALEPATFAEQLWASELDPKIVEPLYLELAEKDDAIALALARVEARAAESNRALIEESIELAAPLLAARLKTDRVAQAAQLLGNAGPRAARAIPALRRAAEGAKDAHHKRWCTWAIARIGNDEDVAFAAKLAGPKPKGALVAALAARGVGTFKALAIDSIRQWLALRERNERNRRDDAEDALEAAEALGTARAEEALPILHEILATPYLPAAMHALSLLAHPSSREPVTRILDSLAGDAERNWAYRLPAEDVLRAIAIARGEPSSTWPSLDAAREVLAHVRPRRYAWPKLDDERALLALAARALRIQGDEGDLARIALFANSSTPALRAEGALAHEKLHGARPELEYWDAARVARAAKKTKPAALLAIAQQPTTVFRHNILRAVAESKDEKARTKLADFAKRELESRPNFDVSSYEESDLGPDLHGVVDVLEILAKKPALKKRLAKTTSLWIKQHIFEERPSDGAWAHFTPAAAPLGATVRALGARAQGSFAIGRHTNALAYANDGTRLAVVGDRLGMILDASTGETVVTLDLHYYWAYGTIFSNDDKCLYVAYHGGHVEAFDAATGKSLHLLKGHGGVPDGVRGMAMSPDGKRLLTAGSEGLAFLWSLPGGRPIHKMEAKTGVFHAAAFSRDSKRFAISMLRGKKARKGDAILLGDSDSSETLEIPTQSSMWACAFAENGVLACAGEGAQILFSNEQGKPVRKLAQTGVVALQFTDGDRALVAMSQTGEAKLWDIASGKSTTLDAGDGPLWALAENPKTHELALAGTQGIVHRFDAKRAKIGGNATLTMHTDQARGFAVLADGRFFTCGWDGRLLLWSRDGTREVAKIAERMTDITLTADERHVLVLHKSGLLCFDTTTLEQTGRYAPKITNASTTNPESLAVCGDVAAVGHYGGFVKTFSIPALEPRGEASLGKNEVSALAALDGGFVCGIVDGRVLKLSPTLEREWTLADHGRDLVDGEPMGNPHASVTSVTVHGRTLATSATDHSVRLYDISGAAPVAKKRVLAETGLFNDVAFSPSGARLIIPTSFALDVFDATMGTLLAHLEVKDFPDADELTRVGTISEDEFLVGAENGRIFSVTLR